jgi:signal transduction histidine kinase
MPLQPASGGTLFFGVDARHIRQLGQELVGDRVTAVTELIKNSYDADATQVRLSFTGAVGDTRGTLEVVDDGSGMTLDDLRGGWMRVSTARKEDEAVSPRFGRRRSGRKGIGRFATETLGRRLELRTTVSGDTARLVVIFDWENAYPAGEELSTIANRYTIETAPADEHGTRLRIVGLYDVWDMPARTRVNKAVRLLQPPFPVVPADRVVDSADGEPDPGFVVYVDVDGRPEKLAIDGYDDFLAAATARMTATVDAAGAVTVMTDSPRLGLHRTAELSERFPGPGPFRVEASYFIFLNETLGSVTLTVARAMAAQYAGLRVYRDGLRVMPYGEIGNDWLGLDELASSRSGVLVPVANNNWFGQIAISRVTNPDLRDTASREGIVDNDALRQMRGATRAALLKTATDVAEVRQRKVSSRGPRAPTTRDELLRKMQKDIADVAERELSGSEATRLVDVVASAITTSASEARASDSDERAQVAALLGELELLRILASLGTSIAVFSHEVRSVLNTATAALDVVLHGFGEAGAGGNAPIDSVHDARTAVQDLADLAAYIDAYVSASRRREREPQPLSAVLREFVDQLSGHLARNVDFEVRVHPISLRTETMARSELVAVLINLLTNAVKAMDAEGGERRISIDAAGEDREVVVRFQDTGAGINATLVDRIFDAFVTDTASSISELGAGTGLGLKIVRDIAEANGGSVAVADADDGYRTCFEVRLPRWSRQVQPA